MFVLDGLFNVLNLGIQILVPLLGLIFIGIRVHGRARALGIAGCAVLIGSTVLQTIWYMIAPRIVDAAGDFTTMTAVYGVTGVIFSLVFAVGLALLIAAVLAGHSSAPGRPGPATAPYPYQQQPPNPYRPQ